MDKMDRTCLVLRWHVVLQCVSQPTSARVSPRQPASARVSRVSPRQPASAHVSPRQPFLCYILQHMFCVEMACGAAVCASQ
jgi:hypothetical protein